jgi:hypothetical protein
MTPRPHRKMFGLKLAPAILITSLIAAVFAGCITTIVSPKGPEFAIPADSLRKSLGALMACEDSNLTGTEVVTNGKPNAVLELDIINGRNIPADDRPGKALAKAVASVLKKALKDKNEYDTYKVLFVAVKSSGSATTRSWKGFTFKTTEL